MSKIYKLQSDSVNYSIFLEKFDDLDGLFAYRYSGWQTVDLKKYKIIEYSLEPSDTGLKNYKMDVSTFSSPVIVFSELSINILKPILEKYGQIIPIVTPSKRKKFFGFYANKNIYNTSIVNINKSEFKQYPKVKLFYKIVFNNNCPKNDYIFTLDEDSTSVFVTDKFKKLIEDNNLKGFDFTEIIEIADES